MHDNRQLKKLEARAEKHELLRKRPSIHAEDEDKKGLQ
jgi:hypothetical protein